jgi:hypothetical protein
VNEVAAAAADDCAEPKVEEPPAFVSDDGAADAPNVPNVNPPEPKEEGAAVETKAEKPGAEKAAGAAAEALWEKSVAEEVLARVGAEAINALIPAADP